MSRPTKYTPDLADRVREHLAAGGTVRTFARSASIGKSALYEWLRQHSDLRHAVDEGRYAADRNPPPPTVPVASPVISLAVWGHPLRRIQAEGITPTTITDEDVDDMLARAA